MLKMVFLDYRDYEIVDGFKRELNRPREHEGNPVLVSDHPVEGDRMSLYGSVLRRPDDGLWQMWYTVWNPSLGRVLAYAESEDGIQWHRPEVDVIQVDGQRTHLVFEHSPHGATVVYDEDEARAEWRYKMLVGALPSDRISAFRSGDGIHWFKAAENPVVGINPDCPMSLHRTDDGRYVLYCRPWFGDRRVSRRESWDFVHWTEPKIVIDQEPGDTAQTQFYGLGAIPYGAYEIGTLWMYRTEESDLGFHKMHGHQYPELAYTRTGYAWHRASLGEPWIGLGEEGSWKWGMIQPASSPVILADEMRFYYAGIRTGHGVPDYEGEEPRCGIGFASLLPDRFVGVRALGEGHILTRPFWSDSPEIWVNACVGDGGQIRVEVDDVAGKPIEGFELGDCVPTTGDSVRHRVRWRAGSELGALANREIRLRVRAEEATVYALLVGDESDVSTYWRFSIPDFLDMDQQRRQRAM
jgi:hypothetical protein